MLKHEDSVRVRENSAKSISGTSECGLCYIASDITSLVEFFTTSLTYMTFSSFQNPASILLSSSRASGSQRHGSPTSSSHLPAFLARLVYPYGLRGDGCLAASTTKRASRIT
jgi:hypothetical protein